MKKSLLLSVFAALACWSGMAVAQDYVPVVREGVQRVYLYDMGHNDADVYVFYTEEMRGETIINGIQYSNLYRYYGKELDVNITAPYAYVREVDKRVYAVLDENHPFEDLNVYTNGAPVIKTDNFEETGEYLIYDFNDFVAFYDEHSMYKIVSTGEETVGDAMRTAYYLNEGKTGLILESVGAVTEGGLLFPLTGKWVNGNHPTTKGLSHVIENGEIVYKSPRYEEMQNKVNPTGISDITVAKKTNGDNRYYNLMGQPVAEPTQPGIYIHHGKKIVIK